MRLSQTSKPPARSQSCEAASPSVDPAAGLAVTSSAAAVTRSSANDPVTSPVLPPDAAASGATRKPPVTPATARVDGPSSGPPAPPSSEPATGEKSERTSHPRLPTWPHDSDPSDEQLTEHAMHQPSRLPSRGVWCISNTPSNVC